MPCYGPGGPGQSYTDTAEIDRLTRIACSLMRRLKEVDRSARANLPLETVKWWERHTRLDQERARRAETKRLNEEKVKAVRTKLEKLAFGPGGLTKEERKLLDI